MRAALYDENSIVRLRLDGSLAHQRWKFLQRQ
jgi:hypothetical protein